MSRYCDKSVERMYSYLDREITFIRRARIRIHLRRCPPCADGFHFEERLKERVRSSMREDPPPELYDRLWAFLHRDDANEDSG
jgi:mycothiol system anti-sigma-R factor